MITIKKDHGLNEDLIIELINKFNNVIRYSYNRRIKNKIEKLSELEKDVKLNMLNINCLDESWIKTAVKKSTELQTEKKLYFGGKTNYFKRKYKKIEKYDKNFPLEMRGSASDGGNRKAKIENNIFIFKPSRKIKFEIELKLSKNEQKLLSIIENGCKNKTDYFNFKLDRNYIYISFNEPVMYKHNYKKNRFLGIDLNPNYIGLCIMDIEKEIYKEIIDLKQLNKENKFKKRHELAEVNKHIINLCKSYNVEYVCLEDLNIKSMNNNKGKKYNKLVNNDWIRNYIVNNLIKWLNINNIKLLKIIPHYSSFIGQMKFEKDYDSVAASKELAYRGYLITINKNTWTYINNFLSGLVTTRWKEMLPEISTFKDLYNHFKMKSKTSYRFLFNDSEKLNLSCLRLKSYKSTIDLIRF